MRRGIAMSYKLNKNLGECVELPVLVLNRLTQATEGAVRTALYIIKNKTVQAEEIATALGLSATEVENALIFWLGAGLLSAEETMQQTTLVTPAVTKRAPRLSQREVVAASQKNPDIAVLLEECQNLLGEVISPADMTILASLHLSDDLPIDLILTGISHFVQEGKRSIRYIERRLLAWQKEGITTCEAAERYLSLLEIRSLHESNVADMLGISANEFTTAERTRIATWYEDFQYDDDMVEQAALRVGANKTIKYLNGILRKWHSQNIRTTKDIKDEPQNVVVTSTKKHTDTDYVAKTMYKVPKLKNGGKK